MLVKIIRQDGSEWYATSYQGASVSRDKTLAVVFPNKRQAQIRILIQSMKDKTFKRGVIVKAPYGFKTREVVDEEEVWAE